MSKIFLNVAAVFVGLIVGTAAFGADGMVSDVVNLAPLGAALAIGLAAFGAASGQGRAVTAALEGISRNPGATDKMFMPMILGLVFMEFQALLGFVVAFLALG